MSVKLILLTTGETVISDAKEIKYEDKCVGYLLKKPQVVTIFNEVNQIILSEEEPTEETKNNIQETKSELKISMGSWMPLSNDDEIVIYPNSVVSIVEPVDTVKSMYEEKVNG
jgi:hypothetical protein